MGSLARRVIAFYVAGFRGMTVGRTLWLVVAIKLAVLALLAWTLFPDRLATAYPDERDRADHVLERLSRPAPATTTQETP